MDTGYIHSVPDAVMLDAATGAESHTFDVMAVYSRSMLQHLDVPWDTLVA